MPLFMHIEGVEGPYEVEGLGEDLFSVDTFSHGLYQPQSEGGGHSRAISTAQVSEFIVSKKVDSSTALLMQAICKNQAFDEIKVFDCVTEADAEQPTPVSTYTMTNASIVSLTYSGSSDSEASQVLAIKFDTIHWQISSVDRLTGKVEDPKEYLWEAKAAGVRS
ncbi:MAG: type VI secretion system tube protein Hcp [bacterium]